MKRTILLAVAIIMALNAYDAKACTGITLHTKAGATIPARTIEWAGNDINSRYVIVPRGYTQRSYTPDGGLNGMEFTSVYGYVGLAVDQDAFVVDGMNEAGLTAGLFYFPGYGGYVGYNPDRARKTLSDFQLVSWILGNFDNIDAVKKAIRDIDVVAIDPRSSTVHWRITEPGGRQVVLEIIDGKLNFHENTLGVFTNSPDFRWHLTNLNNYINLATGPIAQKNYGDYSLSAFGGGSGMLGLPGDMTPPSRFVRAAFFQMTAPKLDSSEETVAQAFHILNSFDIPVGIQFAEGQEIPDIPSATQWTVATDISGRKIYYRTMYNSNIRCIDLAGIDFGKVHFQSAPLDEVKSQSFEPVRIGRR